VSADPATWIVGVRAGGGAIARAYGARRLGGGAFVAPRGRARALASALGGLLDYAEPNRIGRELQAPPPDPLSPDARWRDFVVGAAVPPAVTPASPLIGLVDTLIDVTHPEIAGSNITTAGGASLTDEHGTATATTAAAPANGVGMLGIWPGARALNLPLRDGQRISCADSVRGIEGALRAGASVINMSYGSRFFCTAELQEILRAIKKGAVPVAAAGNEFAEGNPLEFPASLPHVLTVAAITPDEKPTAFSSDSAAVDLSAPGVNILTGVPVRFDTEDGDQNGFTLLAGTSFAAPMVSAAVAWVRAARPELTAYQAAQVVRLGARDIGQPGYENSTGFGALHMPSALSRQPPADDPLEPNDDVRYVNGRAFATASPPIFRGRKSASITAAADYAEDPVDVYRVKVRARHRVRLTLKPVFGDPDLFVFGPKARSVDKSDPIASSSRKGKRTDSLSIRNRSRRTRTFYAAVGFDSRKDVKLFDTGYTLFAH
jgi:subtilisin family serine protease